MNRHPANPLTPGSAFMVNMDSVLRQAEAFNKGQISTQIVRDMILQCQAQTVAPAPTPAPSEYIQFDYIHSDGSVERKLITHDDMRQRYDEMRRACADLPKRAAAQAQQLRYALHSLQKVVDGEPGSEKFAALSIKHITCGQYVPETAAPDLRAFGLKVGYEIGSWVDAHDPLPDVEKIVDDMLLAAPKPFSCQYDSERREPSLDCMCGACTDQA